MSNRTEDRPRPQLTVGEVIDFMSQYPRSTLVSAAPSEVNLDEPVETQEFILSEVSTPVVAVDYGKSTNITIGYEISESSYIH